MGCTTSRRVSVVPTLPPSEVSPWVARLRTELLAKSKERRRCCSRPLVVDDVALDPKLDIRLRPVFHRAAAVSRKRVLKQDLLVGSVRVTPVRRPGMALMKRMPSFGSLALTQYREEQSTSPVSFTKLPPRTTEIGVLLLDGSDDAFRRLEEMYYGSVLQSTKIFGQCTDAESALVSVLGMRRAEDIDCQAWNELLRFLLYTSNAWFQCFLQPSQYDKDRKSSSRSSSRSSSQPPASIDDAVAEAYAEHERKDSTTIMPKKLFRLFLQDYRTSSSSLSDKAKIHLLQRAWRIHHQILLAAILYRAIQCKMESLIHALVRWTPPLPDRMRHALVRQCRGTEGARRALLLWDWPCEYTVCLSTVRHQRLHRRRRTLASVHALHDYRT